ncbi:MAG: hypothetical protein R3B12_01365 [Candidatus Saccharimonadales bacterium]
MQKEVKKPKVRLTRKDDGSIGLPTSSQQGSPEQLTNIWGAQKKAQATRRASVKQELSQWRKARVAKKQQQKNQATKSRTKDHKKITNDAQRSVSVRLPHIAIPNKLKNQPKKRLISVAGIALVVMVTGVVIANVKKSDANNSGEVQGAVTSSIQTNVTPEFPMLTPFGKGVDDLGGFAKISPNGSPPVYAFADSIGSVKIKVSQQQLPDALRTDQAAKLKELANSFNANDTIEIDDNTAYIGASVNGAQSVVYIKGENLVLIASESTIPNADWVTYIGNLKF